MIFPGTKLKLLSTLVFMITISGHSISILGRIVCEISPARKTINSKSAVSCSTVVRMPRFLFIGYDISHSKKHSEYMAGEIDKEVKMIIDKCYKKAKEIILKYEDILHSSAGLLIEREKIGREEFEALFEGHEIFEDVEVEI